ncbi:MAG TPA: hypothetical protein VGW09_09655 [Nitrososphaeraceae archaeon]|nr:hypothetical protein [Nitrososphaeraceae archaeon]
MKSKYPLLLLSISIATTLFSAVIMSGLLFIVPTAHAQLESTTADQAISSINQAKEFLASGNSTAANMQLTLALGELNDLIANMSGNNGGTHTGEHVHSYTHKGNTHHITHNHPHNTNHHESWFQQHHIFNPSKCNPGLMC